MNALENKLEQKESSGAATTFKDKIPIEFSKTKVGFDTRSTQSCSRLWSVPKRGRVVTALTKRKGEGY